jgi:hypothetical protein
MRRRHARKPSLTLILTSLALAATPVAFAGKTKLPRQPPPRECGCDDLKRIESELQDQEDLESLFKSWDGYVPASIYTVDDMQDRALTLMQLTFYGARSQAPLKGAKGAHAELGTELFDDNCPIVMYEYKDGHPVLKADPPLKKGEKRRKVKLIRKVTEVDADHYPAHGQCAALVHSSFVHEEQHQTSCHRQANLKKKEAWHDPGFYATDDAKAYTAGNDVLRKERDRLVKECPKKKKDGKWHGTLTYGLAEWTQGEEPIKKGTHTWLEAFGKKQWGDHKSKRLQATLEAESLERPVTVRFTASTSSNHYSKYHLEDPKGECGWYKKTYFMHDSGDEDFETASASGTMEVSVTYTGQTFSISITPPEMKGTFVKRNWNVATGYCGENLDQNVHESKHEPIVRKGFNVSIGPVTLDPDHPEQIIVKKVNKKDDGKSQEYIELSLTRE